MGRTTGRARYLTNNVTTNTTCPHCAGSPNRKGGLVCIDDPGHGTLAPCPMCQQGKIIDQKQYDGAFWTQRRDPNQCTWNSGKTLPTANNKKYYQPAKPIDFQHETHRSSI